MRRASGGMRARCAVLSVARRWQVEVALERAVERCLAFIADLGGNLGDASAARCESTRAEPEAPAGEIGDGGLAEVVAEPFREHGARDADRLRQLRNVPGMRGTLVKEAQHLPDRRIAHTGEPADLCRRQAADVAPHC